MTDQHRRFPPPWDVDDTGSCFIVRDANGQALGYVYYENEPGRGTAAGLLTRDEARRIALNVAKLPELAKRPQYWACHGESIRRPTVYLPGGGVLPHQ